MKIFLCEPLFPSCYQILGFWKESFKSLYFHWYKNDMWTHWHSFWSPLMYLSFCQRTTSLSLCHEYLFRKIALMFIPFLYTVWLICKFSSTHYGVNLVDAASHRIRGYKFCFELFFCPCPSSTIINLIYNFSRFLS